jgi:hypothetical protein
VQERHPLHHELVQRGVEMTQEADYMATTGGQLGRPNSARRRTYERLNNYLRHLKATTPLFVPGDLERTIDDVYRYPLRSSARDTLSRQLRAGINDDDLADLVMNLWKDDRLSLVQEEGEQQEPRILCSLGLFNL